MAIHRIISRPDKSSIAMKSTFLLNLLFFFSMIAQAQDNPKPIDRLGVKGPINFDAKAYNLVWSAHPSPNYFKQEYLQQGEDIKKFKTMLLVEVATGAITAKNAIDGKMAELKAMRASNPFISYESSYNEEKKEYILDFVITQNTSDNRSAVIAERNVYRYKNLPDNNGVMLFSVSTRSYGADTKSFLENMKNGRKALVDKVKAYTLPAVRL